MYFTYTFNLFTILAISALIIIILQNKDFLFYKTMILNDSVIPLRTAHSHNDYLRKVPVFNALNNGFCSIEADIYFINNELYLGHESPTKHLLKDVYLDSLKNILSSNKNNVIYENSIKLQVCKTIDLIIDFKDDDSYPAWYLLETYLMEYDMFQCYNKDELIKEGPIRIILSGNHPKVSDVVKGHHCSVVDIKYDELINGNYTKKEKAIIGQINTKWVRGWNVDEKYIKEVVKTSKTDGINASVRFWGIKEFNTNILLKLWDFLLDHGVDRIGTDNIVLLKTYLLN